MPKSGVYTPVCDAFRDAVDRDGFATPEGTLGIEVTGTLDETLFASDRPEHAGRHLGICLPPGLQRYRPAAREDPPAQSRETELAVLTLPSARDLLSREGIELISYRDRASKILTPISQ